MASVIWLIVKGGSSSRGEAGSSSVLLGEVGPVRVAPLNIDSRCSAIVSAAALGPSVTVNVGFADLPFFILLIRRRVLL